MTDLALDQSSQRHKDQDGRLHIAWTPISKAMVCPYYGREIPRWRELGLDPNRIYQLWRHPEELNRAASTFNNVQVMSSHVAVNADDPKEEFVAGSLGTDCEFRSPYLGNSMVIWRAEDIAAIENNRRRQISAGYYYDADMTPGEYEGCAYDGIMRNIRANHVALVEAGRAGPDVLVTDSGEMHMPQALTSRKALIARGALAAFLRPHLLPGTTLALDQALGGVNRANWKTKKPEVLAAVIQFATPKLAKDAALDKVKADLQMALDRMDDEEDGDDDEVKAKDAEGESEEEREAREKREKEAKDKKAKDAKLAGDKKAAMDKLRARYDAARDKDFEDWAKEEEDEPEHKADDKAKDAKAMDAAITAAKADIRADFTAAAEARELVRPIVGNVSLALDTAEGIYRFALKQKGVDAKAVHASALKAMVQMLPVPNKRLAMATDAAPAASLHQKFPDLARIGHA